MPDLRPGYERTEDGMMKAAFLRFILLVSLALYIELAEGSPVVALSNIPPPGNFKPGGSTLDSNAWKALLFTTPNSARSEIVSVQVGLSCITCGGSSEPYPYIADLQVTLYSVSNQAGVMAPNTELYSIPMQYGLVLTGRGTLFTFQIPHWELAANTHYALVIKSTDTHPVKWGNVEVNSNDEPPEGQNGFSFDSAFLTQSTPTTPLWTSAGLANNNGLEMQVVFTALPNPIPTLNDWAQILMMLALISMGGLYRWNRKSL